LLNEILDANHKMDLKIPRYRQKHLLRALKDPRIAPALTYTASAYPEDFGIPEEFQCFVWLAFDST